MGMSSNSLKKHILSAATGGLISSGDGVSAVNALNNINLELKDGDRLGLIGHNGAGKSTLLKVLAGIYAQTKGKVLVNGRIVSTLNLSIGTEKEATGKESIISCGLLHGMKMGEIKSKLNEIMKFTELGEYLNMPIRIYSSGMLARIAFGTVTAINADIVLMDEVVGTGDASFIEKTENRLNDFMGRTKILVLASHSEKMIQTFCNKAILLVRGEVITQGKVGNVLEVYKQRQGLS